MNAKFYIFLLIVSVGNSLFAQNQEDFIKFYKSPHTGNTEDQFPEIKPILLRANENNNIAKDQFGNSMVIDTNGDGEISYNEALAVYELDFSDVEEYDARQSVIFMTYETTEGLQYFKNLKKFVCDVNFALYAVDVSRLESIEELSVSGGYKLYNNVVFGYHPYLKKIDISGNKFSGLGRITSENIPNLESLIFSDNIKLKNFEIKDFKNLKQLNFDRNCFENGVLSNLPLTSFTYKDLEGTGKNCQKEYYNFTLEHLPNIDTLNIQGVSSITLFLKDIPNLSQLTLNGKQFFGSVNFLNDFPKIKKIVIKGYVDLETKYLPNLEYLQAQLNNNSSSDLSKNPKLSTLILDNTIGISGELDLTKNTKLKHLSLINTAFDSVNLSKNSELQYLDIELTTMKNINLSKNRNLDTLHAGPYYLTDLDLSKNAKIRSFKFMNKYYNSNFRNLNIKNGVKDYWLHEDFFHNNYYLNSMGFDSLCVDKSEFEIANKSIQKLVQKIKETYGENLEEVLETGPVKLPVVTTECNSSFESEENNDEIIQEETTQPEEEESKDNLEINLTNHKFRIYPNPVNHELYISSEQPVRKIEIFDSTGKLILSNTGDLKKLNVSSLSKGIYYIIIHTNNGKIKDRFIKL
ncbi:T9SS type A sorting domain-containing protein [Apibacter muscae]|uniref:T9SS type A sorting domain-containing protein n=1 Tax=Apibacter muscae TaxID=2509004 RepID=UPI0016240645|nr:T9SS type A sorting domain-containing protein [Apibacter muscae]